MLTFFAQDSGNSNLVYASADLFKATQAREITAFCDHWKHLSGSDAVMLVMDQKVTTQQVLGELDSPRRQVPNPADALTRSDLLTALPTRTSTR